MDTQSTMGSILAGFRSFLGLADKAAQTPSAQTPADADDLTADEISIIDKLYLDVKEGRVTLESLDDDEAAQTPTGKASVSGGQRGGSSGSFSPSGGASGHSGGKQDKCYMRLQKIGVPDNDARKICRHALRGAIDKQAAKETPATLAVHKQADGQYRWVLVSSSAYKDRDGEIVSEKALADDTAAMQVSGEYGTLDWWHTPLTLGVCDFAAMHGRTRIESGTFYDPFIGERLSQKANELAASLSFRHSVSEPDAGGVYNHIQTFARAILPRGYESNLLTSVNIGSQKESSMLVEKFKVLVQKLGGDKAAEDWLNEKLSSIDQKQAEADAAGIAHKEADAPKAEAPAPQPAPEAKAAQTPNEAKPEDKPAETKEAKEPGMFVADMTPEEFTGKLSGVLAEAMKQALAPIVAELAAMKDAQAVATKEAVTTQGAQLLAEIGKLAQAQAATAAKVANLEGLTPRAYRPTQDPATKTDKQVTPHADEKTPYLFEFANKMAGALGAQPAPKP